MQTVEVPDGDEGKVWHLFSCLLLFCLLMIPSFSYCCCFCSCFCSAVVVVQYSCCGCCCFSLCCYYCWSCMHGFVFVIIINIIIAAAIVVVVIVVAVAVVLCCFCRRCSCCYCCSCCCCPRCCRCYCFASSIWKEKWSLLTLYPVKVTFINSLPSIR